MNLNKITSYLTTVLLIILVAIIFTMYGYSIKENKLESSTQIELLAETNVK